MKHRILQNLEQMRVHTVHTLFRETPDLRLRMNARREKHLIGIDVADSAQEPLVEQYRLHASAMLRQALDEIVESHGQGVWPDARQHLRHGGIEFHSPEHARVVIDQRSVFKLKDGSGVFRWLKVCFSGGRPKQLSGHAQMDVKQAAIKVDENLFAATPDSLYSGSAEAGSSQGVVLARHSMREQNRGLNRFPVDVRRNRADHGFDFGKLRHISSLTCRKAGGGAALVS